MASTQASRQSLILRRLYRSLLKAAKPFTEPSPDARVLTCLLHRTGLGDQSWEAFLRDSVVSSDGSTTSRESDDAVAAHKEGYDDESNTSHAVFRRLLKEVVAGSPSAIRVNQWPSTADPSRLLRVIRHEFRLDAGACPVDSVTRKEVAFLALRELHKKLTWADRLRAKAPVADVRQPARYVKPLPMNQPKAYLQPGAFLVAHPNLTGYFRRSVICILDHTEEGDSSSSSSTLASAAGQTTQMNGTYGLVVNRVSLSPNTGKNLTLQEILRPLPSDLEQPFGGSFVREGGPVHMSLQMLHAATAEQDVLQIGGSVLSMIVADDDESTALHTNEAIYYQGDVIKASQAVMDGEMEKDDVSFFVGASSWTTGQLESEIERGCWIPCRGPPHIAHSGICEHEPAAMGEPRPKADLWLSMMSACGEDEAKLAHLVWSDSGQDDLGGECDSFR